MIYSHVAEWFARLSDVESYETKKEGFSIDYVALGKGNSCEAGQALIHGSKASSVSKAQKMILKSMREDSEHKNDLETEVCPDSTFFGTAKDKDQSVEPKPKTSKRSKSDEQETVETWYKAPVSEPPKQKTSKNCSKETQKVKYDDIPVKEIQEAKPGPAQRGGRLGNDLGPPIFFKEESNSIPTEKTKRPRKLSSLFK
ncbi:hypothetical protein AALP_AA2G231600 [Arabis alpina]|uniref:Uncharacterized protein n=1 Tax=Arabis alpina TaxID=50452 RepID=A0A087HJF3_ARAAL|nr:hypothetical protein AALP_AA2G231600 [Arabis alpina]